MPVFRQILYEWNGANVWLFHAINDVHGPIVDRIMLLGTQLGSYTLYPVYVALIVATATIAVRRSMIRNLTHQQDLALRWLGTLSVLCVASLLDGAFLTWAKQWFDYPRPLLALANGSVHVVGQPEYRSSLPSGHVSFAMLLVASLWPMIAHRWRWLAATFLGWVSISRINVGAHFPADVVASWITALVVVLLVRSLVARLLTISMTARDSSCAPGGRGDGRAI